MSHQYSYEGNKITKLNMNLYGFMIKKLTMIIMKPKVSAAIMLIMVRRAIPQPGTTVTGRHKSLYFQGHEIHMC